MWINSITKLLESKFYLLFLLFMPFAAYSQNDSVIYHKNAIYFEMGGAGGSHSMNYERVFNLIPKLDASARGGFGFDNLIDYSDKFNPNFVLPVMAIVTYGNNHKIEAGVGQTFSSTIETDISTGEPARMSNFSTTFNIGYRYQNPDKRILIRAGYTPYIEFNEKYVHWAGVSIGFIF